MQSFLEEVADELVTQYEHVDRLTLVMPSKRAGSFLRKAIAHKLKKTTFAPEILSIEQFVEKIAQVHIVSNTNLLFELYDAYLKTFSGQKDTFYEFSKWGQVLLQDFNEIDRYLVAPSKLFSYLTAIKEVTHWSLQAEQTSLIKNYLLFWKQLQPLYDAFTISLEKQGVAYQGMAYRKAHEKSEDYQNQSLDRTHIFIGFNALNTAESGILQKFLSKADNEIFWDLDRYFLEDPLHEAGYFIRQHQHNWQYLKNNPLKGVSQYYTHDKEVKIVGAPKSVSQAKYVATLLKNLHKARNGNLDGVAVVLGDEALLNPLLNSIPIEIDQVNITMGLPLRLTPVAGMLHELFELYLHQRKGRWYYKKVLSFLSHPYLQALFNTKDVAFTIKKVATKCNWVWLSAEQLLSLVDEADKNVISMLFYSNTPEPSFFIARCHDLIIALKDRFEKLENSLALEYLFHFNKLVNELDELINKYPFVSSLKSLHALFTELLRSETLDFQGEPLKGLQIMGMLESRNLDFETVILSSVNEGILPSGKSNNSFIPYDIKKEFKLPTYKEKDAVYTYHFYRLLQRAKTCHILYNIEPDVLEGGERSRFVSQLITDHPDKMLVSHSIAAPHVSGSKPVVQEIPKEAQVLSTLKKVAIKGFSPTALSLYIRDPISFYKKVVLGIEDPQIVEETLAANTFGTVVHGALETLYAPFVGSFLKEAKLERLKNQIEDVVRNQFQKHYPQGDISKGKNLVAFQVILKYLEHFIDLEITAVRNHQIQLLAVEKDLKIALDIPGLGFPIHLKGKIDRLEIFDGTTRIVDYKTGRAIASEVQIVNWTDTISGEQYIKAFQLLCYALMYAREAPVEMMHAGIVSFKNLKGGLLQFATKEKPGSRTKNPDINKESLSAFQEVLEQLILDIFNPELSFAAETS